MQSADKCANLKNATATTMAAAAAIGDLPLPRTKSADSIRSRVLIGD